MALKKQNSRRPEIPDLAPMVRTTISIRQSRAIDDETESTALMTVLRMFCRVMGVSLLIWKTRLVNLSVRSNPIVTAKNGIASLESKY